MASEEDKLLSLMEELGAKHKKKKIDDEKFIKLTSTILSLLPKPFMHSAEFCRLQTKIINWL